MCLAGAVLWSLPMLAAGLVALLQYGFGSLFVVGESLAAAVLRSAGADIAGTVSRLHAHPVLGAIEAAAGLLSSAGAASLVFHRPITSATLAAAAAAWAWWHGMPLIAAILLPGAGLGFFTALM